MAQIPNEIKQDPNWARAVAISKQYAVSTYPATWVLNFINEFHTFYAQIKQNMIALRILQRKMEFLKCDQIQSVNVPA